MPISVPTANSLAGDPPICLSIPSVERKKVRLKGRLPSSALAMQELTHPHSGCSSSSTSGCSSSTSVTSSGRIVTEVLEEHPDVERSEEHTSELQSRRDLVCRLLLEKKKS